MTKHTPDRLTITFAPLGHDLQPATVVLASDGVVLGKAGGEIDKRAGGIIHKAAKAAGYKGKSKSVIELLAPSGLDCDRLIVLGTGKDTSESQWTLLGGAAVGAIQGRKGKLASLIVDAAATEDLKTADIAACLAFGALLRHYSFTKYITKKDANGEDKEKDGAAPAKDGLETLVIHCSDPAKAETAFEHFRAVANGVTIARNLVNEPANVLGPVEFAKEVERLEKVGVEVEILGEPELEKLKMGSLLSVSQGSTRPARVCIMQWHGAKSKKASRSRSRARASCSIPAAIRSSRRPAWRT